jgi:hypothetical protein
VLVRAPLLACWAVIAAAPSGSIGTVAELQAMLGAMSDTRREAPDGSVVGGLATSLQHRLNNSELHVRELPVEVVRQRAIEAAREAVTLLRTRGATDVEPPYRDWVTGLASRVAGGSKEAGGLGAGDRVHAAEGSIIDGVRQALQEGMDHG